MWHLIVFLLLSANAVADVEKGYAASKAGDYETAVREYKVFRSPKRRACRLFFSR